MNVKCQLYGRYKLDWRTRYTCAIPATADGHSRGSRQTWTDSALPPKAGLVHDKRLWIYTLWRQAGPKENSVLAHGGGHGEVPQTGLTNRKLFPRGARGWKSKVKVSARLVSSKVSLVCRWPPSYCVCTWPLLSLCGLCPNLLRTQTVVDWDAP